MITSNKQDYFGKPIREGDTLKISHLDLPNKAKVVLHNGELCLSTNDVIWGKLDDYDGDAFEIIKKGLSFWGTAYENASKQATDILRVLNVSCDEYIKELITPFINAMIKLSTRKDEDGNMFDIMISGNKEYVYRNESLLITDRNYKGEAYYCHIACKADGFYMVSADHDEVRLPFEQLSVLEKVQIIDAILILIRLAEEE